MERDLVTFPVAYYFAEATGASRCLRRCPYLLELAERGQQDDLPARVRVRARLLREAVDDLAATTAERFHGARSPSTEELLRAYALDNGPLWGGRAPELRENHTRSRHCLDVAGRDRRQLFGMSLPTPDAALDERYRCGRLDVGGLDRDLVALPRVLVADVELGDAWSPARVARKRGYLPAGAGSAASITRCNSARY